MWHQPWAVQRSHQGRGYQCCKCQRSESDRQTQKPCGVTLGCQVAANFQLELFETLLDWTERTVPVHLRTIPITAFDITQNPPTPSKHPKQVPYANCGNFNQVQPSVIVIGDDTNPNCRILQSWQVVILMRHGDRTPVRERFGDLFQNISIFVSAMSEAIACNYIVFPYSKSLQQLRSHVEMVGWCFGRVGVVAWGKPVGCSSAWRLWHQEIWMYQIWLLHGRPCCRASWNKQRWILCGSSERKVKDTITTHHLSEKVTGKLGTWHEPNRKRYMMASQALRHVPFAYSFQHISILILILRWVFWKWSCTLLFCSLKSSFQLAYSFEGRSIFQARQS